MLRKKWLWVLVGLIVIGGVAATVISRRPDKGTTVTAETIQRRNLDAIVSASGKIEPQKTVNISAQTMGRVTRLAVNEGDRVKAGQFLLQIDPVVAEAAVRRDEAAVAGARTALEQSRVSLQSARASLELARQALKRQQELNAGGLTTEKTSSGHRPRWKCAKAISTPAKRRSRTARPNCISRRRGSRAAATPCRRSGSTRRSTASSLEGISKRARTSLSAP